jgi:endonuclease III related protein
MLLRIYETLLEANGCQGWWPLLRKGRNGYEALYSADFKKRKKTEEEQLEIAIGAILTQNTSWKNALSSLQSLKTEGLLDIRRLREVSVQDLAECVRSSGYYNQKAKKIKSFVSVWQNKKKRNREDLLSIWGLGYETVDDILLYALDEHVFVVDSYTRRILKRQGWLKDEPGYEVLRKRIEGGLTGDLGFYNDFHAQLVRLGVEHCKPNPLCADCPLRTNCVF